MPIVSFNDTQKAAIVSLLIEMINADSVVEVSECEVFDAICVEYSISDEIFLVGRGLDSHRHHEAHERPAETCHRPLAHSRD